MTAGNDAIERAALDRLGALESGMRQIRTSLNRIERRLDDEAPRLHATTFRAIESLLAVYRYVDTPQPLPRLANPFGGWAISSDMARLVCELFIEHRPLNTVELGSGASTVLLGHLATGVEGARVVSLDHDAVWYADTLQQLHSAGLDELVELRYAPLEPAKTTGHETPWYAQAAVEDLVDLDFIVIDGPPGHLGPTARYPAGPVLASKARPGCLWLVDDIVREQEREMVGRWNEEFDLEILDQYVWHGKGAALMRTRSEDSRNGE